MEIYQNYAILEHPLLRGNRYSSADHDRDLFVYLERPNLTRRDCRHGTRIDSAVISRPKCRNEHLNVSQMLTPCVMELSTSCIGCV